MMGDVSFNHPGSLCTAPEISYRELRSSAAFRDISEEPRTTFPHAEKSNYESVPCL
jgi:hypothetical protein